MLPHINVFSLTFPMIFNRKELIRFLDPKHRFWSKLEAASLIQQADNDQSGTLDIQVTTVTLGGFVETQDILVSKAIFTLDIKVPIGTDNFDVIDGSIGILEN